MKKLILSVVAILAAPYVSSARTCVKAAIEGKRATIAINKILQARTKPGNSPKYNHELLLTKIDILKEVALEDCENQSTGSLEDLNIN